VSLEATFADLSAQLLKLDELLRSAQTTLDDRPELGDVVLVDLLGDAIDDALGWLADGRAAAQSAAAAVSYPADLNQAQRHLTAAQEAFDQAVQHITFELTAYERLADLRLVGRERAGEWRAWSSSVHAALMGARQPLLATNRVLFACWRELSERAIASALVPAPTRATPF
jgi:hypothetical protein